VTRWSVHVCALLGVDAVVKWQSRLEAAFGAFAGYRPGKYIDQFPELRAVAMKHPADMTTDDVSTLLWKARHAGARRLVTRCLPEIMERHVQGQLYAIATRLYATLLAWSGTWSREEYNALTDALLIHWHETIQRHRPPHLTVTTGELAFLLLWLEETAPVEPMLLDLAQRYHRQEAEFEWDDSWGSETWTPFITAVRAAPMQSLLSKAAGGEFGWAEYSPAPAREAGVLSALRRTGVL
jgi:hypothetical protein